MILTLVQRQKRNNNTVKNVPFFSSLSDEEIAQIEQLIKIKQYSKDQIVLFEEDTCNYMYFVYSGKVRVVKQNEEGREQIITIHKKNDFFGEMAILDGKTAPATIIAHEDSVIGFLTKYDFDQLLLNRDGIRAKIIELLCERLRDSWAMIKILSFDNAENRLVAVLERLRELYGVKDDRGIIICVKLTHQQIANYASISRESVTRMLNRLEKDQFIEILENKYILLTKLFGSKFKNVA